MFVRDLGYAATLVGQVLIFATPVFYPVQIIPERFRDVLARAPLAAVVEGVRRVIFHGQTPDWAGLALATVVGVVTLVFGYAWFMRSRRAFGDVM